MRLKSGENVIDRHQSHLHPSVLAVLPEALDKIMTNGRKFIVEEIKFDRIIGESNCIVTGLDDTIVFAKRPKRFGCSRFVKNRVAEPCSSMVCILKAADEQPGAYVLVTAFIGSKPEPEPWDRFATQNSKKFWNEHALVWGSEEIITGTEINVCPW